jgi:hypothetical protein
MIMYVIRYDTTNICTYYTHIYTYHLCSFINYTTKIFKHIHTYIDTCC